MTIAPSDGLIEQENMDSPARQEIVGFFRRPLAGAEGGPAHFSASLCGLAKGCLSDGRLSLKGKLCRGRLDPRGDGTPMTDSSGALVSDGEAVLNAGAA